MATSFNHTVTSSGPTNPQDAKIAAALGTQETAQATAEQRGKTSRVRHTEAGLTQRNTNSETGKTERSRITQRGRALMAGWIAVPTSVATLGLGVGGLIVANNANQAAANTAAAQAQADAGKITVETGDRNMCNMVVISTDEAGNKTVMNLGAGNPNDPHLTGDTIAQLIKDGKATGANVTVGDTNEGTAIITLDSKGKIVSKVIPKSCEQDAGQVFDSPKA